MNSKILLSSVLTLGLASCMFLANEYGGESAFSKDEAIGYLNYEASPDVPVVVETPMPSGETKNSTLVTYNVEGFGQYFTGTIKDTNEATFTGLIWMSTDDTLPYEERFGVCAKLPDTDAVCTVNGSNDTKIEPGTEGYPETAEYDSVVSFECSDGTSGTANVVSAEMQVLYGEGRTNDGREFDLKFFDVDRVNTKVQCLDVEY